MCGDGLSGGNLSIRGVFDAGQGARKWAATNPLLDAGVRLFKNKPGTGVRKVHRYCQQDLREASVEAAGRVTGSAAEPHRRFRCRAGVD
jgi:hypothetical protein